MTVWQRILRYLILWGVLLGLLCIISIVRYWSELNAIAVGAFHSSLSTIIVIGVVVGLCLWALRLLIRPLGR